MMEGQYETKHQATANEGFKRTVLLRKYIYEATKKSLDIILAIIGLIVSTPIIAVAALLIKLESEGPVLYTQERVGKDGSIFTIYKLRTMCSDAEKNGVQWAQKNDPRITKAGRFLRKTRIDELPQLFNVLKGEMSIVGPRPERPYFTEKFSKEIPRFNERLLVRPGITGWSQINGGYELSPSEKLQNDLYYIENRSLLLDMLILIKTIIIVFTFSGAR